MIEEWRPWLAQGSFSRTLRSMCGRYVSPGEGDVEREFAIIRRWERPLEPSYNVAPTQTVPIVRAAGDALEGVTVRWGLIPFFARGVPPKFSTINARVETVETAASYRGPWQRGQRCIQIASGFYEWHLGDDGRKVPYYIHLADRSVFGFAALWDRSVTSDGTRVESCVHITLPGNTLLRDIHNTGSNPYRMPAILRHEDHEAWLRGTTDEARAALVQYPADLMVAYAVSNRVNAPKNNDPSLIEPVR